MKRRLFVCALIAICLSIGAYSTTAYFSHEDTATNVITAGNVRIALRESAIPDGGGDPIPFEDPIGVVPGTAVSKIVQVENTGSQPAWVRIAVDVTIELAAETGKGDTSLLSYDLNQADWTERDGYYYYNAPLGVGEVTSPLFTQVIFSQSMGNLYQDSKAIIDVTAQATQTAHNGSSALDAAGWPGEKIESQTEALTMVQAETVAE